MAKPDLPLRLKIAANASINNPKLIAPHHTFAPYDQQTTLHLRSALWALLLPATVQQQAADSFRSYVMQVRISICLMNNHLIFLIAIDVGCWSSNCICRFFSTQKKYISWSGTYVNRYSRNLNLGIFCCDFLISDTVLLFRKSDDARQGEKLFYFEIDNLAQFLTQWTNNEKNFIEHMEQLFVALYKHGYIKLYDLYLLQLWLQELYQMDYIFPTIVS